LPQVKNDLLDFGVIAHANTSYVVLWSAFDLGFLLLKIAGSVESL